MYVINGKITTYKLKQCFGTTLDVFLKQDLMCSCCLPSTIVERTVLGKHALSACTLNNYGVTL